MPLTITSYYWIQTTLPDLRVFEYMKEGGIKTFYLLIWVERNSLLHCDFSIDSVDIGGMRELGVVSLFGRSVLGGHRGAQHHHHLHHHHKQCLQCSNIESLKCWKTRRASWYLPKISWLKNMLSVVVCKFCHTQRRSQCVVDWLSLVLKKPEPESSSPAQAARQATEAERRLAWGWWWVRVSSELCSGAGEHRSECKHLTAAGVEMSESTPLNVMMPGRYVVVEHWQTEISKDLSFFTKWKKSSNCHPCDGVGVSVNAMILSLKAGVSEAREGQRDISLRYCGNLICK